MTLDNLLTILVKYEPIKIYKVSQCIMHEIYAGTAAHTNDLLKEYLSSKVLLIGSTDGFINIFFEY